MAKTGRRSYEISWEKDESDADTSSLKAAAFVPDVTHLKNRRMLQTTDKKNFLRRADGTIRQNLRSPPTKLPKDPGKTKKSIPSKTKMQESSNEKLSLKDLNLDDKKRVANLIKELAKVGEEKEIAIQQLSVERQEFQMKLQNLQQETVQIAKEREVIQQQYLDCQHLLTEYQAQICKEQAEITAIAQKKVSKSLKQSPNMQQVSSKDNSSPSINNRVSPSAKHQRVHSDVKRHPNKDALIDKDFFQPSLTSTYNAHPKPRVKHMDASSHPKQNVSQGVHPDHFEFQPMEGNSQQNANLGGDDVQPHSSGQFSSDEFYPLPEQIMTSTPPRGQEVEQAPSRKSQTVNSRFCGIGHGQTMSNVKGKLRSKHNGLHEQRLSYQNLRVPAQHDSYYIQPERDQYQRIPNIHPSNGDQNSKSNTVTDSNGDTMQTLPLSRPMSDLSPTSQSTDFDSSEVLRPHKGQCRKRHHDSQSIGKRQAELQNEKEMLKKQQEWLKEKLKEQEELLYQKQLDLEAHRQSMYLEETEYLHQNDPVWRDGAVHHESLNIPKVTRPPARLHHHSFPGEYVGDVMHPRQRQTVERDHFDNPENYPQLKRCTSQIHHESRADARNESLGHLQPSSREMNHFENRMAHEEWERRIDDDRGRVDQNASIDRIQGRAEMHHHHGRHLDVSMFRVLQGKHNLIPDGASSSMIRPGVISAPTIHPPSHGLSDSIHSDKNIFSTSEQFTSTKHSLHQGRSFRAKSTRKGYSDDSYFLEELIDHLNEKSSIEDKLMKPAVHTSRDISRVSAQRGQEVDLYGLDVASSDAEEEESRVLDEIFFLS